MITLYLYIIYIDNVAVFTTLTKINFMKRFWNTKVGELDEIFHPQKFSAIQSIMQSAHIIISAAPP